MANNIDHSLDAAKGDLLLGLLEDLGQIDANKIANTYEKDVVLRFVIDSIGLAQDIFFSDAEADLRGAVERAALVRNYVRFISLLTSPCSRLLPRKKALWTVRLPEMRTSSSSPTFMQETSYTSA